MFDRSAAERSLAASELLGEAHALVVDGDRYGVQDTQLATVPLEGTPLVYLGRRDGRPLFLSDAVHTAPTLLDFRAAAAVLSAEDVALLSYAKGMLHWTRRTRFCGGCGSALESRQSGHVRFCPNCGTEVYPRTDPAVMMLVTHRGRLLLAQHRGRPVVTWSTLAGFVEPGESLEAAIRRELLEETGLIAGEIRYFGSQSWPLPASLMIGFTIETAGDAVTIDATELAGARWFAHEELDTVALSSPISLSRQMIESWRRG